MPLPGPPVRQSRLRAESIRYEDTDEVIQAIEELGRSHSLPYEELRNILLRRRRIEPLKVIGVGLQARVPIRPSFKMKEQSTGIKTPETRLLELLLTKPLSRKESRACERELASARDRETLTTDRANAELAHYREERLRVKQRITEVKTEIDMIGLQLNRLGIMLKKNQKNQKNQKKQEDIFSLQALYDLERLQKQEELMRLQDSLPEIAKNIKSTLRKYEDKRTLIEIGGTRRRSRSPRHKWSLKYKRSINCKHPKGFSQRQHCKYGRKNRTNKK